LSGVLNLLPLQTKKICVFSNISAKKICVFSNILAKKICVFSNIFVFLHRQKAQNQEVKDFVNNRK